MKFVLASQNAGKLREMRAVLAALGVEVVLQSELGLRIDVAEDGTTFAENARLKAAAVCKASGLPAIGDDSGLCVDALNGGPGIYSARYGGAGLDDAGKCQLLLNNLRGASTRAAHFETAISCVFPDGRELKAAGRCDGTIAYAPMGEGGFGFDPVFFVPGLKKTFAQLTAAEKNAISHRGNALRAFAQVLKEALETGNR